MGRVEGGCRVGPELERERKEGFAALADGVFVPGVGVEEVGVEAQEALGKDGGAFRFKWAVAHRGVEGLGEQREVAKGLDERVAGC